MWWPFCQFDIKDDVGFEMKQLFLDGGVVIEWYNYFRASTSTY